MALKPGEVIESAIWITGDEPQELRQRYEQDVTQAIDDLCHEHGVIHGPLHWREKLPGSDRVPAVPDHIQGSQVRLLVAEAEVTGEVPKVSGSFIANLEPKDLTRLRFITRRASKSQLTDQECDEIIEHLGPEAALDTLRRNVGVTVH